MYTIYFSISFFILHALKTILWGPKWSNQYSNIIITMQRSNRGNIHLSILGRFNSNEKYHFQLPICAEIIWSLNWRISSKGYLVFASTQHSSSQTTIIWILRGKWNASNYSYFSFVHSYKFLFIRSCTSMIYPHFFPDHIQIHNWWKKSSGIKFVVYPSQ